MLTLTPVEPGLQIVDTACYCKKSPEKCCRIVIENKPRSSKTSSFDMRCVTIKKNTIVDWNLSIFGRPRHPYFGHRNFTQRIECKFLNLDFQTVEKRQEFGKSLGVALELRDQAQEAFNQACKRASFLDGKPNHKGAAHRSGSLYRSESRMSGSIQGSETTVRRHSTITSVLRQPSTVSGFYDK